MSQDKGKDRLVLVTGASGYVGGRLVPVLEERGERVRCLARNPQYLAGRFCSDTEIVAGRCAGSGFAEGCSGGGRYGVLSGAFYGVRESNFEEQDRIGAQNFARVALQQGVRRVIYLGGLVGDRQLSSHLASRQEVGAILTSEGPETLEFRASIVIGSGSLSFELVRSLVNKLPIMITPSWVRTPTQPIAIADVIAYLIRGLDVEAEGSAVFEIGGPQQVTYGGLMREYARQIGVRRLMIPVPFLSPRLSSLWLGLVTPLYARVGKKLIDSLRNETVVRDDGARERFPVRPLNVRQAMARALEEEDREMAQTRWSDAVSSSGEEPLWGGRRFGSRLVDRQQAFVNVEPARAFDPVQRIGGDQGWYFATWLWYLRGFVDLLLGGVGMRRGRRHPVDVRPGDPLDFWRVEAFEEHRLLRLQAEMKVPGRAWLQFEVQPVEGGSQITQTAIFDPLGLGGLLYWYGLYPIHYLIFKRMLKGIVKQAELDMP